MARGGEGRVHRPHGPLDTTRCILAELLPLQEAPRSEGRNRVEGVSIPPAFVPALPGETGALDICLFAAEIGFSERGVLYKYVDLNTGRPLPDLQAGVDHPTAPWWNVRELCSAALRLYTLTHDERLIPAYRKAQNASYLVYPNQRIGGQMIQMADPFTLEPLDIAPATGNLDPMHDPRANFLCGLGYATGIRGACHTNDASYAISSGILDWPDIGIPLGIDVKQNEGVAEFVKHAQDLGQIMNAAVFCYMIIFVLNGEDMAELLSAATGFDYSFKEIEECAERMWITKRGLDNLMGTTAADDRLPRQILTPNKDGGAAGQAPNLEVMLKEFYPVRGLGADGRPSKETLNRLGLSDLAAKL